MLSIFRESKDCPDRTLRTRCSRKSGRRIMLSYFFSTSSESELFIDKAICAADLNIGDKLRIGWPPDRICTIRYLGDNNFIAEETANSTMQPGDTFSCIQIQKGRPLHLDNFRKAGSTEKLRYVVGINTGLTIKVNLCSGPILSFPAPAEVSVHRINVKCLLQLLQMRHTQQFEGLPCPRIEFSCTVDGMPHSTFVLNSVNESQIEQGEEIRDLINGLHALLAVSWILSYYP